MTKENLTKAIKEGTLPVGAHYFKVMVADVFEEGSDGIEVVGYYPTMGEALGAADGCACGATEFDIFEFEVVECDGRCAGLYSGYTRFLR